MAVRPRQRQDDDDDDLGWDEDDWAQEAANGDDEDRIVSRAIFADPGGKSALRAASPANPRNLPCPTCGEPDRLTPADRSRGYQCDRCADLAEGP
jgi:hypothetical protein